MAQREADRPDRELVSSKVVTTYALGVDYRYELVDAAHGRYVSDWRKFHDTAEVFAIRGRAAIDGRRDNMQATLWIGAGERATIPAGLWHRVSTDDGIIELYLPDAARWTEVGSN